MLELLLTRGVTSLPQLRESVVSSALLVPLCILNESFENQPLSTQTTQREAISLGNQHVRRLHHFNIMPCLQVIIISFHYCACQVSLHILIKKIIIN